MGAVFLMTRSSGKSIRRDALAELSLFATQAALLLGIGAQLRDTRSENQRLKAPTQAKLKNRIFVTPASPMTGVLSKITKLAATPLNVLVHGETGTGKELVAQELHDQSTRASKPFIAVNCAAIPATLLESTLFGHERGAFTGATRSQPGKFTQADGGTLFLDEIGDLPLELQSKLLRVIQEKIVEPLGASKGIPVDLKLICATHHDLDTAVRAGRFRQDLFFRIAGAVIEIPALRDRQQDIVPLAELFIQELGVEKQLTGEARKKLTAHAWPGNVRELQQTVARAAFLADGKEIEAADLELVGLGWSAEMRILGLEQAQLAFTREYVNKALDQNQGRRTETAAVLGISERTLYRILAFENPTSDRIGRNP